MQQRDGFDFCFISRQKTKFLALSILLENSMCSLRTLEKNATHPNVYVHANLLHRLNAWIVGSR